MTDSIEMYDHVAEVEAFLVKMEACKTQAELDKLCQTECLIHERSAVLQREVYRRRGQIIQELGSATR